MAASTAAAPAPMRSMVTEATAVACLVGMRLFVAVWPPAAVLEQIAALPRADEGGLRWTTPDQWHVTLRFFGSVPASEPVVEAMAGADLPAGVVAVAGPTVGRFGSRVLHIPVAGLESLAAAV